MQRFVKTDTDATASIASVIDFGGMGSANTVKIDGFQIHLSAKATAANDLTVTRRSKRGSAYDSVIFTQAMVSVADVVQQYDPPFEINGKDRIAFSWTNDAGADAKEWSLQVDCRG